jgi:hypothetical protein
MRVAPRCDRSLSRGVSETPSDTPSDLRGAILVLVASALVVAFLCLCLAWVKGCGRFGSARTRVGWRMCPWLCL